MAEANETDQQAAVNGGKSKVLVIAGAAVLALGIAAGAYFFLQADSAASEDAEGAEAEVSEEVAPPDESFYIDLKPEFVINFRDANNRPKFLKADLSVATTDSDVEEAVQKHMPAIRNNLVLLLSRQVYDDLVPHEGKETLRQQALAEVQSVMQARIGKPGVDDLYFSNFVMH